MSKYSEIIDLLEKATGPSRWLDARIDAALRVGTEKMRSGGYQWAWDNFPVWCRHMQSAGMCGVMHANGDLGLIWDSERFTASIDAALALVERMLPGWRWGITQGDDPDDPGDFQGNIWPGVQPFPAGTEVFAYHDKPQIAILLALFRALEAKEASG